SVPGLTLVELLVVIMVIMILAGFLLAVIPGMFESSYRSEVMTTIRGLYAAIEVYKTEFQRYPAASSDAANYPGTPSNSNIIAVDGLLGQLAKMRVFSYDKKRLIGDVAGGKGRLGDPWEQPYHYHAGSTGTQLDNEISHYVKIYSSGPDNEKPGWDGFKTWRPPTLPIYAKETK
ncbi:MAG: type II secretion system GspH family protein, partial [Planctomycetota bacterium]|nr:type II secretion system GspH family protein [Planctomycetota bacterium]